MGVINEYLGNLDDAIKYLQDFIELATPEYTDQIKLAYQKINEIQKKS